MAGFPFRIHSVSPWFSITLGYVYIDFYIVIEKAMKHVDKTCLRQDNFLVEMLVLGWGHYLVQSRQIRRQCFLVSWQWLCELFVFWALRILFWSCVAGTQHMNFTRLLLSSLSVATRTLSIVLMVGMVWWALHLKIFQPIYPVSQFWFKITLYCSIAVCWG